VELASTVWQSTALEASSAWKAISERFMVVEKEE
jgi:hypothetical protein